MTELPCEACAEKDRRYSEVFVQKVRIDGELDRMRDLAAERAEALRKAEAKLAKIKEVLSSKPD